jgi:glycosyltransferase involved in cell wall biosynthesis
MMAARPVLTTALGGALEIITARTGLLVRPADPQELASALRNLILDAALRARIGNAARSRAMELCDPERQLNLLASTLMQTADRALAS